MNPESEEPIQFTANQLLPRRRHSSRAGACTVDGRALSCARLRVFLTGATGLLGGELLVALSARPGVYMAYLLARPREGASVAERLQAVFALHGDAYPRARIVPVAGDLLDGDLAEQLAADAELGSVDVVIHAAASTSFLRTNGALI